MKQVESISLVQMYAFGRLMDILPMLHITEKADIPSLSLQKKTM
ncbi:MAG: hypothetical protein ACYSW6_11250 [Planctomycetota bacterium]|jgi:hypothetical protein